MPAIRARIGYMRRRFLIADMPAISYVRNGRRTLGLPADLRSKRSHESLFYVGLGEARYRSWALSLGMKANASLAQAVVHGPKTSHPR